MIWKLYESHAQPFTRIVHGAPLSWDSNATATVLPYTIKFAVWSPSGRFVAVAARHAATVDVLDPATLQRLQGLRFSWGQRYVKALDLSPDDRMLSCVTCGDSGAFPLVWTWDLRTGGIVSDVGLLLQGRELHEDDFYITYSMNGKVVGVLCRSTATISVVNVVSGVHTHDIHTGTRWTYGIWTHGESLRFSTTDKAKITIREVGFTQGATQREIETLSIPDDAGVFDQETRQHFKRSQFFPIPCKLAFTRPSPASADELVVWGPRNSVSLLHETNVSWYPEMSFSSDGRFFACSAVGPEVCLWKESPAGYTLIGRLPSNTRGSTPLLSPNGESIITFGGSSIQLWYTKGFSTPSIAPAQVPHHTEDFVLEFVPGRQLAVVVRKGEETVTVLDLKSGLPQLTIDASMKIYGLRVVDNAVVVIGDGVVITWNLPEENSFPHARVGVENSTQTTSFGGGGLNDVTTASISLDFRYVAVLRTGCESASYPGLHIYCLSTGGHYFAHYTPVASLWFPPDELEIWCAADYRFGKYKIHQGSLEYSEVFPLVEFLPTGCPWGPPRGYKVSHDWWLYGPDGKRLFALLPTWRSSPEQRVWNGQFLALLHGSLPQPVILELAP